MANQKIKDIKICGFCGLYTSDLAMCLLYGDSRDENETCEKWKSEEDMPKTEL